MMDGGASDGMTRTYGNLKTYDCNIGGSIK
jgi:hypothetical protein